MIIMVCLQRGKLYPDYYSPPGTLRFCDVGDIIFVEPQDVDGLVNNGICQRYEHDHVAQ